MIDQFTPTLFTRHNRHNRPLHAFWLESQVWFCAQELGWLAGITTITASADSTPTSTAACAYTVMACTKTPAPTGPAPFTEGAVGL